MYVPCVWSVVPVHCLPPQFWKCPPAIARSSPFLLGPICLHTPPPLPNTVTMEDFLSSSKESTTGRRTEKLVQSVRRKRTKGSSILAED